MAAAPSSCPLRCSSRLVPTILALPPYRCIATCLPLPNAVPRVDRHEDVPPDRRHSRGEAGTAPPPRRHEPPRTHPWSGRASRGRRQRTTGTGSPPSVTGSVLPPNRSSAPTDANGRARHPAAIASPEPPAGARSSDWTPTVPSARVLTCHRLSDPSLRQGEPSRCYWGASSRFHGLRAWRGPAGMSWPVWPVSAAECLGS